MLKDCMGSETGTTTKMYKSGAVYDMADSLAVVFLDIKVAEKAEAKKKPSPVEENKRAEPVKEDKKAKKKEAK